MGNADAFPIAAHATVNPAGSLEELLMRLRQVRRRLERWVPSSHSIALWTSDYTEVFGAAKRLEASVRELDSNLGTFHELEGAALHLRSLLDKLERSTNEFEHSIVRNAAVA